MRTLKTVSSTCLNKSRISSSQRKSSFCGGSNSCNNSDYTKIVTSTPAAPPSTPHEFVNCTNIDKNASHTNLTKSDTSRIVVYSALTTPDYYINQKQINYFQFPPAELLLDPASSTSISTPSLATTTAVALAASSVSNCGANTISSTSSPLDCASANNSPKSIYHYLHHHHYHSQLQRSPSHAITMGRREIKRSNTSGSTVKSYDSGSGK
uniref:Uncharacterized protein n=1 Tax=Glossina palpalis gambiensis TaxID=67801 RepID=A0A1B0AKL4_9MUSC